MTLLEIQCDVLYAIKYDEEIHDEYNRIFEDLGDFDKVNIFFEKYKWEIDNYYVRKLGIPVTETEVYAVRVIEEAAELEERFEQLIDNSIEGERPDIFDHFKPLEGFETEQFPAMKSYGGSSPSLIRVYAIEIDRRCYIIFYSGIKIKRTIGKSPILRDNVIKRARRVIRFLHKNGVVTSDDVRRLSK